MFKLLDRLTEPENPFVLRFVLVCAAFLYVSGFVFDPAYFAGAFGLGMLAYPLQETRAKYKREERLKEWRAEMAEMERQFRHIYTVAQVERAITPGWML